MKMFRWIFDNILFLITLFLLAFIPLYPKKPLLDVLNTWVYIRAEDFIVLSVLIVWLTLLVRKKINLKTPLTMSILLFWFMGALATIHGVLLIFPDLSNVFPNLAFLSMLRRIEYISLFFIAYAAMKDKKEWAPYIVAVLVVTVLAVALYGIGQRYIGLPAYLTMNEEFAKGTPIRLSPLSRVPSTFGGHYDLAAYLVLVLPIVVSLFFGLRNWFTKLFVLVTVGLGLVVMFFTVSRISFFALLLSVAGVVFFYKRKLVLFSLPIVAILLIVVFFNSSSRLLDRFGNTVKEIDVLVDAKTGEALGNIKEVVPPVDFQNKLVKSGVFRRKTDLDAGITLKEEVLEASPSPQADMRYLMNLSATNASVATSSGIVPYAILPQKGVLLVQPNASTGENLPQGTGYANLALSPVRMRLGEIFYQQKGKGGEAVNASEVVMFTGDFLVKRASAYDLSFTTRYQGEWPNAIKAFKRNVLFGSGYSSISLAIDNNYLRLLGEVGLLGIVSFLGIFLTAWIYIRKTLPNVDSPLVKSLVIGFVAGVGGLLINATLIDVFEASKVAFSLWLFMGIILGLLHAYQTKSFAFYHELKKVATSPFAVIIYLGIVCVVMFASMVNNFFVGDDFTWLRWAASGQGLGSIVQYFTQADGFFYRPGTKLYFLFMYTSFWLNPVAYHIASLILHFVVAVLVFLLSRKILRDFTWSVLAAFLFATLSGYSETIFWISSVGHIFSALFVLLSLLLFIYWEEKKHIVYFFASVISIVCSIMFHELGIVTPLILLLYAFTRGEGFSRLVKQNKVYYGLLFVPIAFYLLIRFVANSHWSGGDYSYNLIKLPFNAVGNAIGYFMLSFVGPLFLSAYSVIRNVVRDNMVVAMVAMIIFVGAAVMLYRFIRKMDKEEKNIFLFAIGFMVIALLPFLGLGNITSRYDYLVSVGFVLLFAFFVKKLYSYLVGSGRDVAVGLMGVLLGTFFLLHIIQVQKLQGDWYDAGLKVNRLFISIEGVYSNDWAKGPMDLYFVNVPIRNGDAWIFPVGLKDALWFTFRNPELRIHQVASLEQALSAVNAPLKQKVFVFDEDGNVVEKRKKLPGQ